MGRSNFNIPASFRNRIMGAFSCGLWIRANVEIGAGIEHFGIWHLAFSRGGYAGQGQG